MPANADKRNLKALSEWTGELACPACHGALRLEEAHVVCTGCGRSYPVVEGIPVLIVERAEGPNR
jgi:uncharacterized protein YbaR (Trm112 family)